MLLRPSAHAGWRPPPGFVSRDGRRIQCVTDGLEQARLRVGPIPYYHVTLSR